VDPLAPNLSPYRGRATVRAVGIAVVTPRRRSVPNEAPRVRLRQVLVLIAWIAMLAVLVLSGPAPA
jgi:hypothetical protein